MPFFDRSIDIVIATHPDTDHIGGLPDVLKRFDVGLYIEPGAKSESGTYKYLQDLISEKEVKHLIVDSPKSIHTSDGVTIEILFPTRDVVNMDTNLASIILEVQFGKSEFLFMGDSPKAIETYLLKRDAQLLDSDVLKVGHHGSKTSSDIKFISVVSPKYSIISAGENNRYGHPHEEVIESLNGSTILETKNGSITFYSNGESIWQK